MRLWLSLLHGRALYIEPGSPWENGYSESFHDKFRDELLNRELLDTRVLVAQWRREYNTVRPHRSLGYRAPAPAAIACPSGPGSSEHYTLVINSGDLHSRWYHSRGQVNHE